MSATVDLLRWQSSQKGRSWRCNLPLGEGLEQKHSVLEAPGSKPGAYRDRLQFLRSLPNSSPARSNRTVPVRYRTVRYRRKRPDLDITRIEVIKCNQENRTVPYRTVHCTFNVLGTRVGTVPYIPYLTRSRICG